MSDQAEMLRRIVDNMNNGLPATEGQSLRKEPVLLQLPA